jgi:DNA-binding MarR family transcriptional regulator
MSTMVVEPEPIRVFGALRRALLGYRHRMDQQLAAAGFPDRRFPQGRVLHMCAGPGDTTISDVGRALGITRQGASKVVAGLRERGYVDVTPSPADGREKIVTLTPRAVAFLAALREAQGAIEARLREDIGDEGIAQLLRYLDAVAGEDAPRLGDLPSDSPALAALRWWDATDDAR